MLRPDLVGWPADGGGGGNWQDALSYLGGEDLDLQQHFDPDPLRFNIHRPAGAVAFPQAPPQPVPPTQPPPTARRPRPKQLVQFKVPQSRVALSTPALAPPLAQPGAYPLTAAINRPLHTTLLEPPPPPPPPRREDMPVPPEVARALVSHACKLHDADATPHDGGSSARSHGGDAWVMLLVESNPAQGLSSMRHDRLKYDRYFERLKEEVDGTAIASPTARYRISASVDYAPQLPHGLTTWDGAGTSGGASGGGGGARFGAFEVYLVSHLRHPLVESAPLCVGVFSKLQSRMWPNVASVAKRCAAALSPVFEAWTDAECALAQLRVGMKIACLRWAREVARRRARQQAEDEAVAHYKRDGRHLRAPMRRFREGAAFIYVLSEMREALDRKTATTIAWIRYRVGLYIQRQRAVILRDAFGDLRALAARLKQSRNDSERRRIAVPALRRWRVGAVVSRLKRQRLALHYARWVEMGGRWRTEALAVRVYERRVRVQRYRAAFAELRAAYVDARERMQRARRGIKLAHAHYEHIRLAELRGAVRVWRAWQSEERAAQANKQYELLRVAAKDGAVGVVDGLLAAGAKVNGADERDRATALIIAVRHAHHKVVRRLLRARADVNAAMEGGWTALTLACESGAPALVKTLLEAGAAPDAALDNGWAGLTLACARGHVEVARLLIDHGAAIDRRVEGSAETALTAACRGGHTAVAQLLVESGADADATMPDGTTAWDLAEGRRKRDVADALGLATAKEKEGKGAPRKGKAKLVAAATAAKVAKAAAAGREEEARRAAAASAPAGSAAERRAAVAAVVRR